MSKFMEYKETNRLGILALVFTFLCLGLMFNFLSDKEYYRYVGLFGFFVITPIIGYTAKYLDQTSSSKGR